MLRLAPVSFALLAACASPRSWVPPASAQPDEVTLVWVGTGRCERLVDGAWVHAPQFDYDFSVEQRRSRDRWESVKSLRRRHPDYDGSAGPRLSTWFFHLDLAGEGPGVAVGVRSSLGDGVGTTDSAFRHADLELRADVGSLAPFDRYRIVQDYRYEDGVLEEVVSLDKGPAPWVRNLERATLFAPQRFPGPPTTRGP